ncbi:ATP-binding protein [Streptacidiphilus anmyonensis]|uniref:ATP-binding protein n=1 Tax=Streptacidiphilus anmyonensis TaxID=405782 RepID=UPI0005A6C645|nr:ATP-binding protein [Streptacidiphilus anmyonensis]
MRVPIRHIVDNLLWSNSGTVWAVFRVSATTGRYAPARARAELTSRLTSMVRQLEGAPRWYGLAARIDAGEVVGRMVDGVDLDRHPAWEETAEACFALLAGDEMYRRTHWLAVPLKAPTRQAAWAGQLSATWTEVADLLGLAPVPVTEQEVAAYRQQARHLAATLASGPALRPARPAEIVWMCRHAISRGLAEPLLLEAEHAPTGGGRIIGGTLRSPSYLELGQVRLTEGGRPAPTDNTSRDRMKSQGRGLRRADGTSLISRRWLEVESEAGTSYQAQLVVAEQPAAAAAGSADVLAQLEVCPFPVDYVIDLAVVASEKAKISVRRKKRELVDQADQYGAETSGLPDSIYNAAGDLGEESSRLEQTTSEVEIQSVTALTVWATTPGEVEQRARTLAGAFTGLNYQIVRPVGSQETLFSLSLPGAVASPRLREFRQHELSGDWALRGAATSIELGDERGALAGFSLDSGTALPVLIDLAGAPSRNRSASLGVVGELGSGKSIVQKALSIAVVDRGGQAIIIDRTPLREWAAFATAATEGRAQIVDAATATVSIDPLRLFPAADGARWAISYLTLQLGVGAMSPAGALLSHAVHHVAASDAPSMRAVLDYLSALAGEDQSSRRAQEAAQLADMLSIVAEDRFGQMVFDPALPALRWQDLTGDMVVFTTSGLLLPSKEALTDPKLLAQQPLEALIGRAVLYLVAAVAREVAFKRPDRFGWINVDECYWLTSSTEGANLVHEIVHDGRKHKAGVGLGSHDPLELGDETTRGLLGYKVVMRHTDSALARRSLDFLGLDGADPQLLDTVTGLSPGGTQDRQEEVQGDRQGECLLRDNAGRIGRVRIEIPPLARIEAKIHTTPPGTDSGMALAQLSGARG